METYVETFQRYHYSWNSVILSGRYLQIDLKFDLIKRHEAEKLTKKRLYPVTGFLIAQGQLYLTIPAHTSPNHFERNSKYSLQTTSLLLGSFLLNTIWLEVCSWTLVSFQTVQANICAHLKAKESKNISFIILPPRIINNNKSSLKIVFHVIVAQWKALIILQLVRNVKQTTKLENWSF